MKCKHAGIVIDAKDKQKSKKMKNARENFKKKKVK